MFLFSRLFSLIVIYTLCQVFLMFSSFHFFGNLPVPLLPANLLELSSVCSYIISKG